MTGGPPTVTAGREPDQVRGLTAGVHLSGPRSSVWGASVPGAARNAADGFTQSCDAIAG
jgi:hypothetical protein